MPEIEVLPWRKTYVIAVEVHGSSQRPHHLRKRGPEKGTYIRVGPSNRIADEQMRQELRRSARNECYDEQPMPDMDSEAIDFRAASEQFEGIRGLARRDFETLRVLVRHQGVPVPTVGGIILFGKERRKVFPDCWIQAGRFAGADRSEIVDTREFHGYPARAVEDAAEFVRRHALRSSRIEGIRRKDRWSIPLPAVREAVINAVVHADYSQQGSPIRVAVYDDRVEVESPGLLPFGLTVEDIQRGLSKLRNRVIGRVFKELGLIEQWGSGIGRMTDACRKAGLPEPILEELGTHFRVTFPLERIGPIATDETDGRILEGLKKSRGMSTRQVAEMISLSSRAARSRLKKLGERGLVVEVGSGPNDPRRRYYCAE
jgi:predicted HTH transcriptional regulator